MMRRRLCSASFTWTLACPGPLLIADGRYEKPDDRANRGKLPNKLFVSRSSDHNHELKRAVLSHPGKPPDLPFYVPGTSLRGPFRAQAERIVRSLRGAEDRPPTTACDPFVDAPADLASCSSRLRASPPEPSPYAAACPACRLFGCTATASRVQLADADLTGPCRSVYRDMIGIDRFTGGVYAGNANEETGARGGANMRFHALEDTTFTTTVTVTNFELWQLGLLAHVFNDFADGMVALGFGKSKGFGQVQGTVREARLAYPAGHGGKCIDHLGSLSSPAERQHYGLHEWPAPAARLTPKPDHSLSLYETYLVADLDDLWRAAAAAFADFIGRPGGGPESAQVPA